MINLENLLNEALPSLIPEYPVEIAGHHLTLRFDVNINKTKKGVKLQFVLNEVPNDPKQLQTLANEIGTQLQQKFGSKNIQIIYDVENPYKNVVGFLLPLPSIANFIMTTVLKGDDVEPEQEGPEGEQAPEATEELPAQEQPPAEEQPIKERMKRIAGL